MNEDDIDIKLKDFSNYLLDIGLLIGGSNYNEFGKKFKEINEKEKILSEDEEPNKNFDLINFKDNISKTMIKFYDSMNEQKKKLITLNIFNIYNKKKEENKNNENNYVINKNELVVISEEDEEKIDEHKLTSNTKSKDKEYIEEHFEIILLSSKNNLILNLNDSSSKSEINSKGTFNYNFNKKNNKKEKNEVKKNNIKKKNEKLILNENCTFQPNIDKNKKNKKEERKNISEVFIKLSKKSSKKEEEIESIRKEIEKECSFQPNLELNNKKNKKDKSKKKINRNDFDKRLKLFEENRKDKEEKRKKEEEKEFNDKCPFVPNKDKEKNNNFNKSFNKSFYKKRNESFTSENIYQRLHEEKNKIKVKYEENLKKLMDDIKDRANHPIVKHNNINYITRRKWYKEPDSKIYRKNSFDRKGMIFYNTEEKKEDIKIYNSKRIEQLYEEYKNMKNELKVEQKQINDNNDQDNKKSNEEENTNKIKGNINISMTNNEEKSIDKNEEEKKEIKDKDLVKSSIKDDENNPLNTLNQV